MMELLFVAAYVLVIGFAPFAAVALVCAVLDGLRQYPTIPPTPKIDCPCGIELKHCHEHYSEWRTNDQGWKKVEAYIAGGKR